MDAKLSRRVFLRTAAAFGGGVLVAACAPKVVEKIVKETVVVEKEVEVEKIVKETVVVEKVVKETVIAPKELVKISFMGWGGTEEDEGVRSAITVFEGAEPNIKVAWLHTPENYGEKLLAMVAAGTPPDTAFIGSDMFGTYAHEGMLLDISDMLKADPVVGAPDYFVEPQETERCTYTGHWYGIGSCWVVSRPSKGPPNPYSRQRQTGASRLSLPQVRPLPSTLLTPLSALDILDPSSLRFEDA